MKTHGFTVTIKDFMSRQEKSGPAAGDVEARYSDALNYVMGRDNEIATVSEPNINSVTAIRFAPSLQHRQSLPTVLATEGLHNSSQRHEYEEGGISPVEIVTNNGNSNADQRKSKTIDEVIASQENNNMSVKKSTKNHVHFFQEALKCDGRVSSVSRSFNRLRDSFRVDTPDPPELPTFSLQTLNLTSNNSGSKIKFTISKSVSYRKARLFCLFGSGFTLTCILFEIGFMFACLYLRYECEDIASFMVRLAFISILIVVIEWLRSCFWREMLREEDRQASVVEQAEMACLASMNPVKSSGEEQHFGISNTNAGDTTLEAPDLRIDEIIDTKTPGNRWHVIDGRLFAVSCILILLYIIFVGLLIGGAVWIPKDYKNRTMVLAEEEFGQFEAVIVHPTADIISTTSKLSVLKKKNVVRPDVICPVSGLYTGFVHLTMHAIFLAIRICFFTLTSGAACLRFIIERLRIRCRSNSTTQSYTMSHNLPGLNSPTLDLNAALKVPKRRRART